jgi:hypothetical protein
LGNGGQVLEPDEDLISTSANTHVGDQREGSSDGNAVVWYTSLRALEEELGGLAILGNTEKVTGSSIQERVTGGGGGSQDDSVNDVGKDWDTGVLHGDNPRRGLCTLCIFVGKCRIIAGDANSNEERTAHVEEEDALNY